MRQRSDLDVAVAVIGRHEGAFDECPDCDQVATLDSVIQVADGVFIVVCRRCAQGERPL